MNPAVDQVYQQIADYMTAKLPPGWQQAWVNATLEPGAVLTSGRYVLSDPDKILSFTTDWDLSMLFMQVSKITNSNWISAKFTLTPDGKFKIDFTYTDPTTL